MASNIKPKPSPKESPTEPFKRAVTGCLRAIARKPELEVTFAAERPGLMGGKARLPEPPRKLCRRTRRRSCAATPMPLRCALPATIRRCIAACMPGGQQARAVFEAVEQARVEAIGARRMDGVARISTAMLDERFHRGKFDEITERADAPIEDALALMVRERLTGMAPPPAAKKLVDLWRPLIEDRAGARSRSAGKRARGPAPVRRRGARSARRARDGRRPQPRLPRTKTTRARRTAASRIPARTATPPNSTRCSA